MPEFVSLRTFRLESTTGHVALFEAGKPRYIPDALVPAAMTAGCVPADQKDTPFYEDQTRAKVEFVGDIRKSMIFLAVKHVAEQNVIKDFDGSGTPKTSVVSGLIGYEVSRSEITDLYQQYLQLKSEGQEYAMHPQAHNIMKVIQAEDKAELVDIAEEFGVPADKSKGLQMRDLRKLLLVKLSGVAAG